MILELASLLLDVLGDEVVDVVEELVDVRLALLNRVLQGLTHGCARLLSESCGVLWLRETPASQILFKTFNWRLELSEEFLPLLHFFIITVALREIGSRVITDTIGDGLDQCGSLLRDDDFSCLLAGVVYSKDIVTVDSDGWHAVCNTSHCNTVSCILIVDGGRDCVHIVSAEEKGLGAKGCRKVES